MKKTLHLQEIPYCPDSCELFERIRELPGAALLDSSFPHARSGRYDILTASPVSTDLPELPQAASEAETRDFYSALGDFH